MQKTINMIALTMGSEGMCGGSRIFIELGKRWVKKGCRVNVFVTEEGLATCRKYGLEAGSFHVTAGRKYKRLGLFLFYFILLLKGISLSLKSAFSAEKPDIVYSTSDFWPDSLTGFLMSKLLRRARWACGFYLFAPAPWLKGNPYRGKDFLRGLLYYFSQAPVYHMVNKFADIVCVTSSPDVGRFLTGKRVEADIPVIMGGVDCSLHREIPEIAKIYDGCFMGRFHPQKGVIELVEIWRMVTEKKPDAKLLIIGYGELEHRLKEKIRRLGLSGNITVAGFTDGEDKARLLNECALALHPALYDSGGMAACEAMACGLPAVSFDLPALRTYYPKGMLKTPCFEFDTFARNILFLLNNKAEYARLKTEAKDWAGKWDWEKKADFVFERMFK